jgi:hypothetical protein
VFLLKVIVLTLVIYLVLNFSKLRRGQIAGRDLIAPFSLSLAASIVDSFIKAAFIIAFLAFIVIFAVCFGVLYFAASPRK